jgi:hypothetical protein
MPESRRAPSTAPPYARPSTPASGPKLRESAPPASAPPASSSFARRSGVPAPWPPPSSAPPPSDDLILALPCPRDQIEPATLFRSTWIVSSLQSLRERGHFERYDALVTHHRDEVFQCVAGTWLDMPTAHAHYAACDALHLPIDEQLAMGRAVGGRAQGTILQTTVKAARGVGVTPWTILPQFDRLWRRGANGGGISVLRTGPKEARVEIIGCALFDIAYFRNAFRGVLLGIGDMFCRSPYVHDVTRRTPGEVAFQLQWV